MLEPNECSKYHENTEYWIQELPNIRYLYGSCQLSTIEIIQNAVETYAWLLKDISINTGLKSIEVKKYLN